MIPLALAAFAAHVCRVSDGDTVRLCSGERVRLLGIDAAELPGHCRKGRDCAPGDPFAQQRALAAFIGSGTVRIEPVKHDRYGRIVGIVRVNGVNASCVMLRAGARYVPRWDDGGLVAKECGR